MKTKFVNVFAAFIAVAAFSLPAFGQDAKSLDELLQMIESSSISETADSRQREADIYGRSAQTSAVSQTGREL
jgi:biopolymer transport protein ExbB